MSRQHRFPCHSFQLPSFPLSCNVYVAKPRALMGKVFSTLGASFLYEVPIFLDVVTERKLNCILTVVVVITSMYMLLTQVGIRFVL